MQKIKRHFHNLSTPEKVLISSLAIAFLFSFSSWFYQVHITATPNEFGKYEDIRTFSAYNGIAAVMGWFYALFILTTIATVASSTSQRWVQNFINKHYWFYLFLTGQSLFLLVLTALIYTSYSLQFTRAGIEFGLIFSIILNIAALFAAHFFYLRKKKIRLKKDFASQMHGSVNLDLDEPEKQAEPVITKKKTENEKKESEDQQMSLTDYDTNN